MPKVRVRVGPWVVACLDGTPGADAATPAGQRRRPDGSTPPDYPEPRLGESGWVAASCLHTSLPGALLSAPPDGADRALGLVAVFWLDEVSSPSSSAPDSSGPQPRRAAPEIRSSGSPSSSSSESDVASDLICAPTRTDLIRASCAACNRQETNLGPQISRAVPQIPLGPCP